MEVNHFQLTGLITEKFDIRESPGGVQHGELEAKHRSLVMQAGNKREAVAIVKVRFSGKEMVKEFKKLELSDEILVEGFIAQSSSPYGTEDKALILHATGVKKK